MFVNKFEKVSKDTPAKEIEEPVADPGKGEGKGKGDTIGDDVTDQFPVAEEYELKVHKLNKVYIITDPDEAEKGRLNEDDITSKPNVIKFIEKFKGSREKT